MNGITESNGEDLSAATCARFGRVAAGVDVGLVLVLYVLLMGLELAVWWWICRSWPTTGTVRAAAISRPILAVASAIFAVLLASWRGLSAESLGIRHADIPSQLGAGAIAGVGAWLAYWGLALAICGVQAAVRESGAAAASASAAHELRRAFLAENEHALVIWLCFWGAIWEELLFRSLLYTRLRTAVGSVHVAVLVTSVLFSLNHTGAGWSAVIGILPPSIVYGYAFVRTRSLLAVVTAHFLYNCLIYAQFQ